MIVLLITTLQDSGEIFGANPKFEFTGMERGESFQIRYIAYSSENFPEVQSILYPITIDNYTVPDETPEITATPNNTNGTVTVSWANLVALTGTVSGTTSFVAGKFNQGLQIDDVSSSLEFDYDVNGAGFTESFYVRLPYNKDGKFNEATVGGVVNLILGYELSTNRFYVTKDGVTSYGNVVTPYTLNGFAGQTLNQFSGNTLANLGIDDLNDVFLFVVITNNKVILRLNTPTNSIIDEFTYTSSTTSTYDIFRYFGKGIFDHIHMYGTELSDAEILAIDPDVETTFGVGTAYLAKLDGNLDAGNISTGVPITGWRIRRNPVGSTITEIIADVNADTLSYVDTTGGQQYQL